jgi:hypothetical protein
MKSCTLGMMLGDRDAQDQRNHDERNGPQNVDPSSAYADERNHTGLRRQPSADTHTVIRSAQAFPEEIVRLCFYQQCILHRR